MMDSQSKVKQLMDEAFERRSLPMDVVLNYTQILCMSSLVRSCNYVGIISEAAGCSIAGCEGAHPLPPGQRAAPPGRLGGSADAACCDCRGQIIACWDILKP